MKIGLQDAVGTIHGAEGAHMKDHIIAAGIMAGAGALPDERTPVPIQEQHLFSLLNRIIMGHDRIINLAGVVHDNGRGR